MAVGTAAALTMLSTARFTEREQTVAVLVAHGLSRKSIARRMGIAIRTVDVHLTNMAAKLPDRGPRMRRIAFYAVNAPTT